jgi:transposase
MDIVIIGIDLGKNSCSLAGMDGSGRLVLRRRMRRSLLESFTKGLERCIIAMEACCGAHHLGRVFATQGHEVRLMPPEYVRP